MWLDIFQSEGRVKYAFNTPWETLYSSFTAGITPVSVNTGDPVLFLYSINSPIPMSLSWLFFSLMNGYVEGKTFLSHILYLTNLKCIHLNSTKYMSKTYASDTGSVRGSRHNIRAWANISWQLWLIKCLTSPSYSPSLLMQNEHENLANKARRLNSSPAIGEVVRFMLFTTIFILLESSTPTKNLCCQQILGRT